MGVPQVIRDGKVAVLISPGFGAGWSTWADAKQRQRMLFSPEVIAWVEAGKPGGENGPELNAIAVEMFGEENTPYLGGADDLRIEWLPVGTAFRVNEYDGSESLHTREDEDWSVA